jgi:hypothetical protein
MPQPSLPTLPSPKAIVARLASRGAPFTFSPVFIEKADTVVSWSPKSGCSHVVLWAFLHEGFFTQASGPKELPHRFRIHVYQKRPRFKARIRRLRREGGAGQTLVRVTRDPKKRLVSIFRHACRFPFLAPVVRTRLGFDPEVEGLSLADLDAVLGSLDLRSATAADPHVRGQWTPLWELDFDRVITLNMDEVPLNPSLNEVERSLGLPATPFTRMRAFKALREIHYARPRSFAKDVPIETYRFRREESKRFPKEEILASPLLEEMARRHYGHDYAHVASGDSAGLLFQPPAEAAAPMHVAPAAPL